VVEAPTGEEEEAEVAEEVEVVLVIEADEVEVVLVIEAEEVGAVGEAGVAVEIPVGSIQTRVSQVRPENSCK
jgi:ApbE superfamily uncharacterized protein (UPF0280 family)